MSIVTYKFLFAEFARSQSENPEGERSKRLKFNTPGSPAVYLAYTFEDWSMATAAAHALALCGKDIFTDWLTARLFTLDEQGEMHLRAKLGFPDSWLIALISERTKELGRVKWALDMAREAGPQGHHAVLPVRFESVDWTPPLMFAEYPRIEERRSELCRIAPGSSFRLPLKRWFQPAERDWRPGQVLPDSHQPL